MKRILTILMAFVLVFVPLGTMPVHATSQDASADASTAAFYQVSFDYNGGRESILSTGATAQAGYKLETLPTSVRPGYTFEGWYTSPTGGAGVDTDYIYTANTVLYAHWTKVPGITDLFYDIQFHSSGGSPSVVVQTTGADGRFTNLPTPTKDGYTFYGWYSNQTEGTKIDTNYVFDSYTKVYARWMPNPNPDYIMVYFDPNGGAWSVTGTSVNSSGKLTSLPTTTRSGGYTFNGWHTSPIGGTKVDTNYVFTENTVIYAQWTEEASASPVPEGTRHLITFDPTGGNVIYTTGATDTSGKLTSLPKPDIRSGYTFNGWYTSMTGGTQVGTTYAFTADTTVYAQWTVVENAYKITYDIIEGSMSSSTDQQVTGADGRLRSLPTPTRNGYTFNGWYTNRTGGIKVDTNYVFTADTTIYAQWTGTIHTITFDPNGGSLTTATQATTGENRRLSSLPTPTRNGYNFNGWYTSQTGGAKVDTSHIFTSNITVYAQWSVKTYRISAVQGEPLYSTTTILETSLDGKLASFPELIDSAAQIERGYTFQGWRMNDGTYVDENYVFTADSYIHAYWVPAKMSMRITYDPMGGTIFDSWNGILTTERLEETTLPNGKIETLPTPTRSGYAFSGWYTSQSGGTKVDTTTAFTANTTIYARWTATSTTPSEPGNTQYVITFNPSGGSLTTTTQMTGVDGKLTGLPTPTRSGYTFDGWHMIQGGARIDTNYVFNANTTVVAQWTEVSTQPQVPVNPQYTITFNPNGGNVSVTIRQTTTDGNVTSLPTPGRSGHTFNGWYTSMTGGTRISTSYVFNANATVYAQWTPLPEYKIIFNSNGGSPSSYSWMTNSNGNGKLASMPSSPTRAGYSFDGWYTNQSGGTKISQNHVFTKDTTVYAQWTSATYTVTFDGNVNTGRGEIAYILIGNTRKTNTAGRISSMPTAIRGYTYNNISYSFDGWYTSRTGGTKISTNSLFEANTTVYAHWSVK